MTIGIFSVIWKISEYKISYIEDMRYVNKNIIMFFQFPTLFIPNYHIVNLCINYLQSILAFWMRYLGKNLLIGL